VLAAKGALALMGYAKGQLDRKLPPLIPVGWPEVPATDVFDEAMTQVVQRFREQTPGETPGGELGPESLAKLLGATIT